MSSLNGPILAVRVKQLEAEVITEIERLQTKRAGEPHNLDNNRRLIQMMSIRSNLERARLTAMECE